MAFILKSGRTRSEFFAKKASTAISVGAALSWYEALGQVAPAAVASLRIAGVSLALIASTDSDYASATQIPVAAPMADAVFEADVTTGTATAAMVGKRFDLDTGATGVNVNGTSHKQVTIVGYISATKVLVKFNSAYTFADAV